MRPARMEALLPSWLCPHQVCAEVGHKADYRPRSTADQKREHIALIPSLDAGGQHFRRGTCFSVPPTSRNLESGTWGLPPRKKLGIGTEGGHPGENWQWGSRRDHLVNWLRCAFLNGAKSTLAMFPETNLVWTVLRARGLGQPPCAVQNAALKILIGRNSAWNARRRSRADVHAAKQRIHQPRSSALNVRSRLRVPANRGGNPMRAPRYK